MARRQATSGLLGHVQHLSTAGLFLTQARGCGYDSVVTASLLPPAAQQTGTGAESHHLTAAARKCTFPARRKHTMNTDMVEDHGLWTYILG